MPNTPLVLSRLIIEKKVITLYVDSKKVPSNLKFKNKIIIKDINLFDRDLLKFSNEEILVEKQISYFFLQNPQ